MAVLGKEVITQHRLRLDIWTPSKRSKDEQADFKNSLIAFYKRGNEQSSRNEVKCMMLDIFLPRESVIASHIWKYSTEGQGLEDFGLSPRHLSDPRNGLLLCKAIEDAFDKKEYAS